MYRTCSIQSNHYNDMEGITRMVSNGGAEYAAAGCWQIYHVFLRRTYDQDL